MSGLTTSKATSMHGRPLIVVAAVLLLAPAAWGAVPGITGPVFNLTAQTAFINQPDGAQIYSWGYGCNGALAPSACLASTCGQGARASRARLAISGWMSIAVISPAGPISSARMAV